MGEEVLFCSVFRMFNQTINSENSEHGQIQIALGDCFKTCLIVQDTFLPQTIFFYHLTNT